MNLFQEILDLGPRTANILFDPPENRSRAKTNVSSSKGKSIETLREMTQQCMYV